MFGHRLQWFDMAVQSWIELVVATPVVLWAGWPFYVRGLQSIIHRSPNMWTLISLGTGADYQKLEEKGHGELPIWLPCIKSSQTNI